MSEQEETDLCSNCERQIEKSALMLHTIHCQRNFYKCSCGDVVHKNEKENHEQEFHVPIKCKHCNKQFYKKDIQQHEQNCTMQPKMCQYCEAFISTVEYADHVNMCGSRTQQCGTCKQHILKRDWEKHQNTNCLPQIQKQSKVESKTQQQHQIPKPVIKQPERSLSQKKSPHSAVEESKVSIKKQTGKTAVTATKVLLGQQKPGQKIPSSQFKKRQEIQAKVKQEQILDQKLTAAKNKNQGQIPQIRKQVIRPTNTVNQKQKQTANASKPISTDQKNVQQNKVSQQPPQMANEYQNYYQEEQFQGLEAPHEDPELNFAIQQSIQENQKVYKQPEKMQISKEQDEQLAAALQHQMYEGNNLEDPELENAILRSLNEN